jgi:hypothetical protein
MTNIDPNTMTQPARTQAEPAVLFRRPFAPGAIGFRAMTKVAYKGEPYAGAQLAAYLGARRAWGSPPSYWRSPPVGRHPMVDPCRYGDSVVPEDRSRPAAASDRE